MTGHWTDITIDTLGRKGSLNRIWNELKANSRKGFPKRRYEDGLPELPNKKQRLQKNISSSKVRHSSMSDESKDAHSCCAHLTVALCLLLMIVSHHLY